MHIKCSVYYAVVSSLYTNCQIESLISFSQNGHVGDITLSLSDPYDHDIPSVFPRTVCPPSWNVMAEEILTIPSPGYLLSSPSFSHFSLNQSRTPTQTWNQMMIWTEILLSLGVWVLVAVMGNAFSCWLSCLFLVGFLNESVSLNLSWTLSLKNRIFS